MRFLRTNTACRVTVGPFFDKTDGVTPETSLTVTNCKLTLMVDDANVPTLVIDASPTASGGNNDMVHVTGDDAGFYDLELTAAQTNYLGRAMLAITDAATHCPVFHEFMILPAMIYDSLVLGTDRFDANVTHVADTAQTAGDIIADTNDIQSRLPATLTPGGTIKAHLVSTDELAITAGSFEPDAFYELSFGTTGNNAIVAAFGTGSGLTALATAAELAKVPKSDGTTSWNATALASIQTAAAAALTAYDPPTHTEMTAAFTEIKGATWASTDTLEAIRDRGDAAWITATGFSTHSAADVWAAGSRTLTSLSGLTVDTVTTTTNLTNAPTNGDFTATMKTSIGTAVAASAVASVTGNVGGNVVGSVGSVVGAVGSVTGAVGSVTGNVGGNVTGTVGGIAGTTTTLDALQTALNSAHGAGSWATATGFSTHSAADVVTALGTGSSLTSLATAAALATVATYVDTEVAAIKAKTDNLPSDPADASDIAAAFSTVNSTLTTIAGYVDTEVSAIKAKTDLIPAAPAAVSDIPTAAQNAAAWGASVVGNSRTRDMYLQGFINKVVQSADGLTLTLYASDDTTVLQSATETRLATTVGGIRNLTPGA